MNLYSVKLSTFSMLMAMASCSNIGAPVFDEDSEDSSLSRKLSRERQELTESGRVLRASKSNGLMAKSAADMATALDIPAHMVMNAQLTTPDPDAAMVLPELGVIRPRQGASLVVLSTGIISTSPPPEPGTDFAPAGTDGDLVLLRLDIQVPSGANRMSFEYNFLSAESPDFVGVSYNDSFSARVTDSFGAREVASATVNSSFFFDASDTRAGGTGYDLLVDDPGGVDSVFGPGAFPPDIALFPDAGITDFQRVDVAVQGGSLITLEFEIKDLGDGILDSAVVIDNVQFSALQIVDPNPGLIDQFDGKVMTDPAALVNGGVNVHSVAADGVSQVLLRVNVPGPGQVDFSIAGGAAPADGTLSHVDGTGVGDAVSVNAVQVSGTYYGFALYRSPEDFNRGGDEADAQRSVEFAVDYVPTTGTGFSSSKTISLVRPPLVLVHGIWDDCVSWLGADIYHDNRFMVKCAGYVNNAASLANHNKLVFEAAYDAVAKARAQGIAATQVDVVGHGTGGLLARKLADSPSYSRYTNFYEGDFNRLITMNTPHLGTRMADELIVFRQALSATQWSTMQSTMPIIAAGTVIEDLVTGSAVINGIGETQVPSHALYTQGGLALDRSTAWNLLPNIASSLTASGYNRQIKGMYSRMEFFHPLNAGLSTTEKQKLILGPESKIFCTDDHDLFVTAYDQLGGLTGDAVTEFTVGGNSSTQHFSTPTDPAHSARLVELLNSGVETSLFAPSMPSPSTVSRVNSCPPPLAPAAPLYPSETVPGLLSGRLEIVSPAPGTPVTPGTTVLITVQPYGGFQPEVVFISTPGEEKILESAPFTIAVTIPMNVIGTVELTAMGIDAGLEIAASDPLVLPVNLSANLLNMEVLNGDIELMGPGSVRDVFVLGHYSDGVTRNLTTSVLGTRYASSNPSIMTVDKNGHVVAVAPGIATLSVRNDKSATSISVTVGDNSFCEGSPSGACNVNQPPVADAGDDQILECLLPGEFVAVALDGSGSSDPDGDALGYSWSMNGAVIAQGESPSIALGAGQHTISLVVDDGQADSAPDQVSISLFEDVTPPELSLLGADPEIVECGAAFLDPGARAEDVCDGDLTSAIVATGSVDSSTPGTYAIHYSVTDAAGLGDSATRTVMVEDATPPEIGPSASVVLWPPNHQHVTLQLSHCVSQINDFCDGQIDIDAAGHITAIYSDEPEDAPGGGDGATSDDIQILGPSTFRVRAERQGGGDGRVYGVSFTVTDQSGNTSSGTCQISVPHDISGDVAMDSGMGAGYVVTTP